MIAPWMPIGQWVALLFYGALVGAFLLVAASAYPSLKEKPWAP